MHPLSQLENSLANPTFFENQFKKKGKLNILFVEPQLSTKSLYKMILPFFYLYSESNNVIQTATAMTGLDKFDSELQLASLHTVLTDEQIDWLDVVFYPFTTQDLTEEFKKIKDKNKKICFCVDFNFYELPENHKLKKYFSKDLIANVEKNILNSDYTVTANEKLRECLVERKIEGKFMDIPYYIGADVTMSDIEEVAASEALQVLGEPKKVKPIAKVKSKGKKKSPPQPEKQDQTLVFAEPIKIGIIYSEYVDYTPFLETLKKLDKLDNVTLVMIGYNPDKEDKFSGIHYNYVKNCSVKYYFKMLHSLKLDFVFVPLEKTLYNESSESQNRYLECGVFAIPLIAPNMYPYNKFIVNQENGFLYDDKKQVVNIVKRFSTIMPFIHNTIRPKLITSVAEENVWKKKIADSIRNIFLTNT